jgi:tRNA (mo5U34)-methyltransferase
MPYLDQLPSEHLEAIMALRQQQAHLFGSDKKGVLRFRNSLAKVSHIRARFLDLSGDVVRIGQAEELDPAEQEKVMACLRSFMPWRKGPFDVFGIEIDAEWRSERKWNRVLPVLPDLADKMIADVGCNNGYYMFRMAGHRPRLVVGFEPYLQHYFAFKTLNAFAGLDQLVIEPLGVEHIALFAACFDVIFLMGILYHRISPVEVLRDVKTALRPGGTLIVESQGIPGDAPTALFPEKTYGKVPGTYFVPTASCLANWLKRAGFSEVELFCSHPMSNLEQRRTEWMVFESFDDFIDPNDPALTVEGYPAPLRFYVKAIK